MEHNGPSWTLMDPFGTYMGSVGASGSIMEPNGPAWTLLEAILVVRVPQGA